MGLSRTVSEINGNFGQKSQVFHTQCICPLEFCNAGRAQELNTSSDGPTKRQKVLRFVQLQSFQYDNRIG